MLRAGIGDIHLSGYQSDQLAENGLTRRLSAIMKSLKMIGDYCRENSILHFEIWGDLINDKDLIYTVAQTVFKDFLVEYSDIEFLIISGNHDLSSTGEMQVSAISVFDGYPNVTIVNSVLRENNRLYLAYSHNLFDILKESEPADILISHFGINEAMLQSGLSIATNVKLTDLKKFKLVLLGHYHKPQDLNNENTRLYYSGNITHLNWNDKNEQKRFIVYDDETLDVQSIPLIGLPEYREFVIKDKETAIPILEEAEKAKNEGNYVRVKKMFDEEIDVPSDLIILENQKEVDVTNRGVDLSQTTDVKLRNFMKIKEIPDDEHDEFIAVLQEHDIV